MRQIYLASVASAFVLILALIQLLFLRVLNSVWWKRRWIKRISVGLVFFTFISAALWILVVYLKKPDLSYVFATSTSLSAVVSLSLIFALPLSGVINTTHHWYLKWNERRQSQSDLPPQSPARRLAIQRVAAVFPVSALALGSGGMTESFSGCNVREIPFYYDDLPSDLEGFKIFHVADIHLGPYIDNDDVEALMRKAEPFAPDLMLITGDISDDLPTLPDTIKILEGLNTPHGAFASMGNHDYYRGAPEVIKQFGKSSIPMMIDTGATIRVGSTDLFVGGADDPRYMGRPTVEFLQRSVAKTLESASSNSFKVLMTHRPSGFDHAAEHGVQLSLAGHTHGTQVGIMGKPFFSEWGGERYVWGHYTIGKSQLYTTSGVGHWFPFRLGCPTEAPIIVLRRGSAKA